MEKIGHTLVKEDEEWGDEEKRRWKGNDERQGGLDGQSASLLGYLPHALTRSYKQLPMREYEMHPRKKKKKKNLKKKKKKKKGVTKQGIRRKKKVFESRHATPRKQKIEQK
jgi:hypothetical protein